LPSLEPYVPAIDSLEDISNWLGTFRERLRLARGAERATMALTFERLKARYNTRRAELS
jgi:hypothetical protein